MNNPNISIGLFIDGGYYACIDKNLHTLFGLHMHLRNLMDYLRSRIAEECGIEKRFCQITESHYFRGRYRASDANSKKILYPERRFEDELIKNDVIFHYKHLREINGEVIEKGIDVWFALEAYELSTIRHFDYVVLITGDADHEMLVRKLKAINTRVILFTGDFGETSATSPLLSEEANLHIEFRDVLNDSAELVNVLCYK